MPGFSISRNGRFLILEKSVDDTLRDSIMDLVIAKGGIQHRGILEGSSRKLPIKIEHSKIYAVRFA